MYISIDTYHMRVYVCVFLIHYTPLCHSVSLALFLFLSFSLSIYLSIYVCLSIYLPICLSIHLSIYLSIYLSRIYTYMYIYVERDTHIHTYIYICMYIYIYIHAHVFRYIVLPPSRGFVARFIPTIPDDLSTCPAGCTAGYEARWEQAVPFFYFPSY